MKNIFLSLGSNIGNRLLNLQQAIDILQNVNGLSIKQFSSVYETEPVGYTLQPDFLNMVIESEYDKTPEILLQEIKSIEKTIGRESQFHWGPRNIDIDVLYFNSLIFESCYLIIPHPEIRRRLFVLEPLFEIAPTFKCPVSQLTMQELRNICPDRNRVKYYSKLPTINST